MAEVRRPYVITPGLSKAETEDVEFMGHIRKFSEEILRSYYVPAEEEGEFVETLDHRIEYDEYDHILEWIPKGSKGVEGLIKNDD